MDIMTIKQITFYVYVLIVPLLITIVAIGFIYIKIKDDLIIVKNYNTNKIASNKIQEVINEINDNQ